MAFFIFLLGLIVGSFLNVCIYRLPRNQSIVRPPSHCPQCGTKLKPWDLVPVVSFLLLKGKCRYCRTKINWRYPLVEFLTGLVFFLLFTVFGLIPFFVYSAVFACFLIIITFIDFEHQLILDKVNYPGLVVGLLGSLLTPGLSFVDALFGMFAGGGLLLLIAVVTRGGIGGGDVKMGAMVGAYLGWPLVLLALLLAFAGGAIVGVILIIMKLKTRKDYIPFGPYIAIGALVTMLFGQQIIQWYLGVFF